MLVLLYCLCWAGLAAYFGYAERHKGLLERNLGSVFGRTVSIEALQTTWVGWSPSMRITGLTVQGDIAGQPALSFDSAAVVVSPSSLFTLWPRFTDFAVEKPSLEIVTLPNNKLQIAGITLSSQKRPGFNRERLISWLLDQTSAAWHNGEIRWRKSDGSVQRYTDISFVFQRQDQTRTARGTIRSPKGQVSAVINAEGDVLSADDWDASVEVIRGVDQQLLQPGALSFKVADGMGQFRLARLDVERIKDFLALSGLADRARWILDAELSGLLHDVDFTFSGPVMKLKDWSLTASATDIDFKSLDSLPALNNLHGELSATAGKGSFNFTAANSTFEWSKLYDKSLPITAAEGRFTWRRNADGAFEVALHQGQLTDPNLSIYDINAELILDQGSQQVSSFGELFTVESINDLSYQDGAVVVDDGRLGPKPLSLDASAKFNVANMSALQTYLPKLKRLALFRNWLEGAFPTGTISNGRASYRGELTPKALQTGTAKLLLSGDFDGATVDYAPQQDWPPATGGRGKATLENDFLTIEPDQLWLNGDEVRDGILTIENIFSRDILLKLKAKTNTSLAKGMAFLFQGPLIKPDNRPDVLPVEPTAGQVAIELSMSMPLTNVNALSLNGRSTIQNAAVMLPEGVPLTNINAVVEFTENTVTSDNITARFLGGDTQARLTTTERAQPPKMRLAGTGVAQLPTLAPWLGEHLLTWVSGEAAWNGSLDIDGANLVVTGKSDLTGVTIDAVAPVIKAPEAAAEFRLSMNLGGVRLDGTEPAQSLLVEYNDLLRAEFKAEPITEARPEASLFDRALIQVGEIKQPSSPLPEGINIAIDNPSLNLDDLLESVIELAQFEPSTKTKNTEFLDALRRVSINTPNATSMSRPFGAFSAEARTDNGWQWLGQLSGDNIEGSMAMLPREDIGSYTLKLSKLIVGTIGDVRPPVLPIDKTLQPAEYPMLKVTIDRLKMAGRELGALDFYGRPMEGSWDIEKFALVHNGIRTSATGKWVNHDDVGSLSKFDFSTTIEEAENALDDMDFGGYIRKGRGSIGGTLQWAGAPHEFDYSRLDGNFDLFIKDGELVQVEPGGGKLLGLLNFNAIARRLVFDFRDVFASGLQFDRMRYRGLLSDGEAILQDAFILTPAVFVRMEGSLDLDRELIDMEVHISPELGGNLTLLSALANPTAGAVVFLTSQLFKDDMRRASFKSYQANGTWEDFEMIEIDLDGNPIDVKQNSKQEPKQVKKAVKPTPVDPSPAEQKINSAAKHSVGNEGAATATSKEIAITASELGVEAKRPTSDQVQPQ